MQRANMMTNCIIVTIVAGLISGQPAKERDLAAEIKALQHEKVGALAKLVAFRRAEFAEGLPRCEAFLAAEGELIDAQMDAAENAEERITLLTEHVKNQTEFLKIVESMRERNTIGLADVYRARTRLINTKILLLRESRSLMAAKK
jgi:hypothetical protein